ncbi:SdiA-regulated domain-containing protein [candidate division KSB1 bacterium]|nr:SdiA-regulated domain-containing protein [candidate division KSB1 bacterium]
MHDLLKAAKLSLLFVTILFEGCITAPQLRHLLSAVVFPHEWVGNIDKSGFNEPSGICWHSRRKTLFVVGDEGDVCELKTDGTLIKQKRIRSADFEGITHDASTGLLYVAIEGAESIIEIDPETFEIFREFQLPRTFNDKVVIKAGGQGIEAITFVPDSTHPEGGTFYVTNQAFSLDAEDDISAIFQVELPLRSRYGEPELLDYFKPGVIDLSGLYFDQTSDHLFVISDAANVILEYSLEHDLVKAYAFPGDNQEGIAVDDAGFIYIAQDSGGIIKLRWLRK